nr:reverse transcriptase domain-containing protein [Tanacetum cinerariifolium]
MRTRSQSHENFPQQEASLAIVEPLRIELPFLEDQFQEDPPPAVLMADNRTMVELLQAPTEGYKDAIQRFDESFYEAWDRFNDLLRSKSKVRQSRAKAVVSKVGTSSSIPAVSSEVAELNDLVRALLLDKKNQSSAPVSSPTPASVKAVEPNCVTCGGSGTLPSNIIAKPKEELKGITTQSGIAYQGPTIPTPPKVVKQGTEPVVAPVSALMPNLKSSIPYPSSRDNERRIDECLALADIGTSINLMPFSMWEALSLPKLTPTCMTLELADRSVSKPIGIAKDVLFKVGVFHFPADFVVVDFEPDPRVSLILGRNEAITYNLDQTVRYSANYNQMTANKTDVIEMACEEYSLEVLGFFDVTTSGNPTPHDDPIVSTTSPTLTLFGDSDFLLFEEADAFLGLEDDPDSPKINPFYYDPEGDILLLETILNNKPLPPLPNHEQYLSSFKKELKVCEAKTVKSFVDEPPEVKLKDLPPHLEYAFLECDNMLPIIIAKELGDEEKSALIKVLKSHKRAIAWKLSDIQGTFQMCMLAIFHDMVEKTMEVFMDNFSVFGNSFENCVSRLDKMLQRCKDTNLSLNWEKSHFMVKEGIVLGHKISKNRIEVDRVKVNVIVSYLIPQLSKVFGVFSVTPVFTDDSYREKLDTYHLSRLENPYENVLDPKEINETFPLETLSMETFRGDSSASWFADFVNYDAGNFIVKGCQKPGHLADKAGTFREERFKKFDFEGWSISITFRFSVGLQTPDDLSRSRLGFIEKMGVHG